MDYIKNAIPLSRVTATVARIAGFEPPKQAEPAIDWVVEGMRRQAGGDAQRVLFYHADAIPYWLIQKYTDDFAPVYLRTQIGVPVAAPMASVTTVGFATLYSGAQPAVHGYGEYVVPVLTDTEIRPLLTVDSIVDAALRAGRRVALVVRQSGTTLASLLRGRDVDYYTFQSDDEVEAKALELIRAGEHDFICAYSMNFDDQMHAHGPESPEALAAARRCVEIFANLTDETDRSWAGSRRLVTFTSDHGAHALGNGGGAHGTDTLEDINLMHFFGAKAGVK